jgi:hypothetical protein
MEWKVGLFSSNFEKLKGGRVMKNEHPIITVPGEFGLAGKDILRRLYTSKDKTLGTKNLMRILRPQQIEGEQEQKAYEEIQDAVEDLLMAGLVTGKKVVESGRVMFEKLNLTPKGIRKAIRVRKLEPNFIIMDVSRPRRDKVLPS